MNFNFWGFIVVLICLVGVPQITMAQSEEDILNSIGSELDDESAKQKEAEKIEKEYKAIKVKADAAFKTKKFEKAKEYYGQMLKLKPDSEFASSRLALIDQEIAKAKEAEARKKYEGLIAKADALMASEKWDEAIAGYKAAAAANPDEQYPKSQISKVEKLKAEAKAAAQAAAIQKQYDAAIATAEKALASKSWDVAKQQFQKASKLKPDESYPREQAVRVDKLKAEAEAQAEQIKLDKRYQAMIDAGDQALAAKDWETAKAKYKLAMETKPAEAYAKEQYNSVDKLKADYLAERERARIDKEYKGLITKADQFFNSKDWESAIPVYEQAAGLKSSESYPKTRITEAKGKIAEELEAKKKAEQQESEFQKHKKIGEEALANEKWDIAIESFVTASSIKPDHTDVKKLLTQAKSGKKAAEELALKQKAEEEARLKTQKQYESAMALGNKALTEKNWDNARQAFNEAKKLKPEESDPGAKLQELDKLIAEEKRLAEEAAEKARLEEEARLKAEQERLAAEKAAAEAAEQERLAAEAAEKARLEEEARLKAEQEKLAAEKAAAEAAEQERLAAEAAEKARLEEEARLKAEEEKLAAEKAAAEAAEQERLAAEAAEKARLEEEAKLKAEQEAAERERLAQEEKQKQEDFKKAVKEYEQAIKDSDWDLALRAINSAQAFFPDNPRVEEMQSELAKLQAKEQEALAAEKAKEAQAQALNKQYEDLIAKADKSFGSKDYESAKADYEQALKLKPKETYPSNRLSEIQELILAQNAAELEKQKEIDRQYSQLMSEGESFISEKNWDAAKSSFNAALELKPDNKGPVERIAEIEALIQKEKDLAQQAEALEADYQERMKNGDEALQNNKFADAKRFYFGASKLKPEEELPKQKLEETEALWAQFLEEEKKAAAAQKAQQLEDNYNGFIMSGDQALNSELWDEAIKSYEGAMALKPEEAYPKEKLSAARQGKAAALAAAEKARAEEAARLAALEKERLKKEAEAQRLAQLEDDFKSYVANGDQAMGDKNLKLAVSSYKKALELKPEDSGVQSKYNNAMEQYKVIEAERIAAQKERQRLAAIELEKRQEEARKKREAYLAELRKNSPEELAKRYPDGITEEVDTENDVVLTKSIIVENGEGRYLIRFDYPWGEHFYYLNGKKIREDAYNWNIRKYKF
ncbi:hypothetical protein KFE94_02690 [bacterium SCSIO 12643]|nr:hypothetical protein KFE94_02690 [bacterium SCSIO 12643]